MHQNTYQQLNATKQYCAKLEEDFKNNLQVIEERELEIEALTCQLAELQQEHQALASKLEQQNLDNELEIKLVRNQYNQKLEEKQNEMQQLATMIEAKMGKQMQTITHRHSQQLKSLKNQLLDRDETNKRLLHENSRLSEMIKEQKNTILEAQSQIALLNDEKNSLSSKMALHQQELEGIRSCNSSWEQMLKDKLKQAQKEKQAVEQELSECKVAAKEKLKRQKQDLNRKIIQISQQKQSQVREALQQSKQLRYKFDKLSTQIKDYNKEIDQLRQQKIKLQNLIQKYKQNQLKSNFQKNQKQYQYLLKIFEQDKRDLKNQIENSIQQRKLIKQELDQANIKRQATQKSVQRLKVQLINKSKQLDQLKKQHKRMKHQFEAKMKQYQTNYYQPQIPNKQMAISKPQRAYDSKGFDIIESVKIENDYSKVYTEDMGYIDEKFFQSAYKSPKNKLQSNGFNQNREAQLIKKISQLQIDLQEHKNLVKKLRQELQGTKKLNQEDRNRQISLYRDKANIYWQKANDKQQQLMSLKQQYTDLKSHYNEIHGQLKKYRQLQSQSIHKDEELKLLRQKIISIQKQNQDLLSEIQIISKERDAIQQISSQLRTENFALRQMGNSHPYYENNSKSNFNQYQLKNQISEEPSKQQQTIPYFQPQPERRKIPKKLHDLVREKKMLSISGKRATIEQKIIDTRLEHVGTDSQKQALEKIKVRNKTPPKIANYAEMKKQKERRSHLLQTASQKQVYQKLKSKQNIQLSPQKGVNYLYLKQMEGL